VRLTKSTVEAIAPTQRDQFIWDERLSGFGLKVTPKGRRSYVVQYRPKGGGQAKRITLGVHGAPWTTEKAREAAERLILRVRSGEDPIEMERAARAAADAAKVQYDEGRFEEVLRSFIALYARPKNRRWEDAQRVITFDAIPVWRGRAISSITRRDVIELIDKVRARSPTSARALYAQLRRLFGWCVERMLIEHSPCTGLRGPAPSPNRDRWLNDSEVRLLWRALETTGGPFEPLFKLLLLTGQRREEVTGMRWSEVDLERAEWVIPRERSKNASAHAVDLAPAAVDILTAVPRHHELVFTTNGLSPMSNHAKYRQRVLGCMREPLSDEAGNLAREGPEVLDWTVHDLRRTTATGMAALGTPPHVIEAVLNHRSGARGGLVAVYQHYQHRAERKSALFAWAKHVIELGASR
jgi:integrase